MSVQLELNKSGYQLRTGSHRNAFNCFPVDSMVEHRELNFLWVLPTTDFPLLFCWVRKSEVYYFLVCHVGFLQAAGLFRFVCSCALLWTPVNDLGRIMLLIHFVMLWGMKRTEPGQGDVGATNGLQVCTLGPSSAP